MVDAKNCIMLGSSSHWRVMHVEPTILAEILLLSRYLPTSCPLRSLLLPFPAGHKSPTAASEHMLGAPHSAARNFAACPSFNTLTTPLQTHRPRLFLTLSRRQIESKHSRDGIESRCARYAGAACWRGSTPDGEQEVEKGRADKTNTYVLFAYANGVLKSNLKLTFMCRGCCA